MKRNSKRKTGKRRGSPAVRHICEKLRDRRGESIAEALAALLLMTLSAVMLAGAIVASVRITVRSAGGGDGAAQEETGEPVAARVLIDYRLGELRLSKSVAVYLSEAGAVKYDTSRN